MGGWCGGRGSVRRTLRAGPAARSLHYGGRGRSHPVRPASLMPETVLPMSNPTALASDASDATDLPLDAADERRHLLRLRELCDEVLASQRVAEGRDVMTDEERREARALLASFTPRVGMRERAR